MVAGRHLVKLIVPVCNDSREYVQTTYRTLWIGLGTKPRRQCHLLAEFDEVRHLGLKQAILAQIELRLAEILQFAVNRFLVWQKTGAQPMSSTAQCQIEAC